MACFCQNSMYRGFAWIFNRVQKWSRFRHLKWQNIYNLYCICPNYDRFENPSLKIDGFCWTPWILANGVPDSNFLISKNNTNEELEHCILKNKEGNYHRPEKSKEEINKILSSIPPGELNSYYKIKDDILEELQNISSC